MSKLGKKFKRIIKQEHAKIRDICIIISEYFNEIGFVKMSPMELKRLSTKDQLVYNYFLARSYYGKYFNIRFSKKNRKNPEKAPFWIDFNWNVHARQKNKKYKIITTPLYPGEEIFEDESKTATTEELHEKIRKLEKDQEKDLITKLNELEDLIKKGEKD